MPEKYYPTFFKDYNYFLDTETNRPFQNKTLLRWYYYLKWRESREKLINKQGAIMEVKYLFPYTALPFRYKKYRLKFLPHFLIKRKNDFRDELQTYIKKTYNYRNLFKWFSYQYPYATVRFLELHEMQTVIRNFKKCGIIKDDNIKKIIVEREYYGKKDK